MTPKNERRLILPDDIIRPAAVEIPLRKLAVICTDMQREFLEDASDTFAGSSEGIGFNQAGVIDHVRPIIQNVAAIQAWAREQEIRIVHLRESYAQYDDIPDDWKEFIGDPVTKRVRFLQRGSPSADIIREVAPLPGEPVFDKAGKDAFWEPTRILRRSAFKKLLHTLGAEWCLYTGVATSMCVDTTARSGTQHSFRNVLMGDACGDFYPDRHDSALKLYGSMKEQTAIQFGRVVPRTQDLIHAEIREG